MIGSFAPRLVAVLLLAAGLGGCITVLPKTTPVQLYSFGGADVATTPAKAGALDVALAVPSFPRESQGDLILARTGDEAAYIGGARWVSPAVVLFQQEALRVFMDQPRGVRLRGPSEAFRAKAVLHLSVREFDVRYARRGAAPTVVLTVVARLSDHTAVHDFAEQVIHVERPVKENRVTAIVQGFDAAVDDVLEQTASFTEANIQRVTN
jgi:cholesterol transport system auxiliary component